MHVQKTSIQGDDSVPVYRWKIRGFVLIVAVAGLADRVLAEDLFDAWNIALAANHQLAASRQTAAAAGLDLASSRAERLPRIQTLNLQSFLTNPISVTGPNGEPKAGAGAQQNFTISAVAASMPIYSGGRIRNTIEGNRALVNATHSDEISAALDLKLSVAKAYIEVLRSARGVAVSKSSVVSLRGQARDVANLVEKGRGIRNDLLAAEVALANARQREIHATNQLTIAWAVYNRYLCRPLETVVPLAELAQEPPRSARSRAAGPAVATALLEPLPPDESQIRNLVARALSNRTELASLSEQARSTYAQSAAERAKTRPQISFLVANLYQNARFLPTVADSGAAAFVLNWTIFDGGQSRRHSMAIEERAAAQMSERDDLASQIKLQVR
jgi:outer membrane protein